MPTRTASPESQTAPFQTVEEKDPGLEGDLKEELVRIEDDDYAFALSLTPEGYATMGVENLGRVINRYWYLKTREEQNVQKRESALDHPPLVSIRD